MLKETFKDLSQIPSTFPKLDILHSMTQSKSIHTLHMQIKPKKSNQSKPNQMNPNQTKINQTKPNQTKPNQTKPNQIKPKQTKQNQIQPNQNKYNQTKPQTLQTYSSPTRVFDILIASHSI